jgi:hypothetical protein
MNFLQERINRKEEKRRKKEKGRKKKEERERKKKEEIASESSDSDEEEEQVEIINGKLFEEEDIGSYRTIQYSYGSFFMRRCYGFVYKN